MFVVIWRFRARPGRLDEFIKVYGPAGSWAALFYQGAGYRGTELLRGADGEYLTLDRWDSLASYDETMARTRDEYQVLDLVCGELTQSEDFIGQYLVI